MVYFIVNLTSRTGKSKVIWKEVEKNIIKSDIAYKVFVTEYQGHATKIASDISALPDQDKCLVVVGGDGTMNEVINGITDFSQVRFGIIPTGSGNDFGRGLKLPKSYSDNLENIIKNVKSGEEAYSEIDLGQVTYGNGKRRLFGISSGIGMDAIVCKMALDSKLKKFLNKIKLGKLTYVLLTVYSLFSMKTADGKFTFWDEKQKAKEVKLKKIIFAAAMNLRAEGGGVPMAPEANGTNGKITLSSAYGIPKWRTFLCLPILMAARHQKLKGFYLKECQKVTVDLSIPFVLHADGEYCGEHKHIEFECLKGRLHLLN